MNIKIDSFRSIKSADLFLPENKYIVIYGNNGIGKTTFVKAISSYFNNEDLEKHRSFYDDYSDPFVEINIKAGFHLFDEDYINSVVIKGNNFINDAYEIIIKTPEIIELEASINEKFNKLNEFVKSKSFISLETAIKQVTSDLPVGKEKTVGTSKKVSYIREPNIITSDNLGALTPLKKEIKNISDWADWWSSGLKYYNSSILMCPFCSQDTNTIDDSIQKFKEIVNGKNAKMRSRVFEGFKTISEDIVLDLNTFEAIVMRNASPDSETNKRVIASTYYRFDEIQEILEQIKNLEVGLENYPNIKLKRNVFKKESPFANELEELLIDYHQSLVIIRKIKNQIVDQIKDVIDSKKKIVNDFLNIAGIDYHVDFISIDSKIDKKMIIRHKSGKLVDDIKNAFSYGEKTAFSLLMFILQFSKIRETKLLVLDDPISSYDDDKRNAILHLLFDKKGFNIINENSTIYHLTHDFKTIQYMTNYVSSYEKSKIIDTQHILTYRMINDDGILSLREITRKDLLSLFSNIQYAMTNSSIQIVKLLYLRKFFELKYISFSKKIAKLIYNYTSSKTKLIAIPTYKNNKSLSNEDIIIVQNEIKKVVPSFDIRKLEMEMDPKYLIEQYDKNELLAYEKVVVFRSIQEYILREKQIKLLFDNSIYRFATGLFHVSDELLFDFCINDNNRVPSFILKIIDSYMIEIKNKLELS